MCGIAGIFAYGPNAPPVDPAELRRIRDRMAGRGPDGQGEWLSADGMVGLGHRRLAIIDLSDAGSQPMASADGRHRIVFNGEIYNYRCLREELTACGYRFQSHSDTEVVLAMYARYGRSMCSRLRGMYAFAIWDTVDGYVFLARDPFGIKPLYLHDDGKTCRFASQVRALLAGGSIDKEIEPAGLVGFWLWGYVPDPWTLYRGIRSLEPGTWLYIGRNGKRRVGAFAPLQQILEGRSAEPAWDYGQLPTLRDAALDSVRHHLISDVPVGVFLSSGIDSATVTALAAESGAGLRTVTLGFEEYRRTPNDETVLAEEVARRYGCRHETVWVRRQDFEDAVPAVIEAMDQPSTDGLNTWLVSRAAASLGLKVALSGLGGDEFFGGYPSFRQVPWIRRLAKPFAPFPAVGRLIRRAAVPVLHCSTSQKYAGLLEYGGTWEGAYLLRRATRMPWELAEGRGPGPLADPEFLKIGLQELRAGECSDDELAALGSTFAIVSYLEASRYMRCCLLRDADWAGMAHSLEIRVPLVDVALTEYLAAQRTAGRVWRKPDLARCASPELPASVVGRPKTGFTVPVRDWLPPAGNAHPAPRGLRAWQQVVAESYLERAGQGNP